MKTFNSETGIEALGASFQMPLHVAAYHQALLESISKRQSLDGVPVSTSNPVALFDPISDTDETAAAMVGQYQVLSGEHCSATRSMARVRSCAWKRVRW